MSWADICGQAAADLQETFGETVTLALVAVSAAIFRDSGVALIGGQIQLDEDRYTAAIAVADMPTAPAVGARVVRADGSEYLVDAPPIQSDGVWSIALRRVE